MSCTTKIEVTPERPIYAVRENPGPPMRDLGKEWRISGGEFFLTPGRTVSLVEVLNVTSSVTVKAVNGDVEIRVLEGARSQPREVQKILVKNGEEQQVHIWGGHWVECKELVGS